MKQRHEKLVSKYPFLKEDFEKRCATQREEILEALLESDADYQDLNQRRADTSQVVYRILSEHGMTDSFEAYSDALYAEEIYELDAIYKEAFLDAVEMIERQKEL